MSLTEKHHIQRTKLLQNERQKLIIKRKVFIHVYGIPNGAPLKASITSLLQQLIVAPVYKGALAFQTTKTVSYLKKFKFVLDYVLYYIIGLFCFVC